MNTNKHTITLYWREVKKHKKSFFLALTIIPLSALLNDTLLPYFFSQTIGSLTMADQTAVWSNLVIAISIAIVGIIANFIGFNALTLHEARVRSDLSNTTFEKIIRKDFGFFTNEKVGALTGRFIDFIASHVNIQDLLIIRTLGFVLSVSIGLYILAINVWQLALVVGVMIALLVLEIRWSLKKRAPWRMERKQITSDIYGQIADAFTNNLIVKTFAGEKREISKIAANNTKFKKAFMKDIGFVTNEGSVRIAILSIIQVSAIIICVFFMGQNKMNIAITIFVLTYLQRISAQVFNLSDILSGYDKALLMAAPMSEILAKETFVLDKPDAKKIKDIKPEIEFKNVSYHYNDNDRDVLKHINLKIKSGEKIGLVGNSGAGKTTLTHLLLRFSDVTTGEIIIGGHNIRDIKQSSLRRNIAYVPQEPMLFHRTLRENINYGRPKASEVEIQKAIHDASATDFINEIPNGLDATVGERGIKLSGGQRQRIAIARAILKNAPILILDEATSALDSENEKLIQKALSELMDGRTSIVIAHRLSTIAKMDRIIVMDDGEIVEEGTHQKLLEKEGIYARLWRHQSGGFIEE